MKMKKTVLIIAAMAASLAANAQTYPDGLIDKTVAVVGNEMISIGLLESELRQYSIEMGSVDKNMRCNLLESMLESKLFLMQARVDSLSVNGDMVSAELDQRINRFRTYFGGDENLENYFGKPLYKLRQEWKQQLEDMNLTQQMQGTIARDVPDMTPYDVKEYLASIDKADIPMVPVRYQLSQICIYPDREAANLAVKEKLLDLRERILNGEKFSTLARIYSEDVQSARKGGELGMTSKSMFWSSFSDAAMSLKPGIISQIVETPDGFHILEVLDKKGDMINVRHILLKPQYTAEDREKAFKTLDSLRTEINSQAVSFSLAARFYSQDPSSRTNGGQMADPQTGSAYFEMDRLKPQDYKAIKDLAEGEISEPVESLDNEGRNGNTVYKIIKVDKVIPAHPATFEEDYSMLVDDARNKRAMEAIDKFINEKIKTTYITIDPIFAGCDFNRPAWKDKIAE